MNDFVAPAFRLSEQRASASVFIDGLLSGVERKTGWMLVEEAGLARPSRTVPELRKFRCHLVLTDSVAGKVHIPVSIHSASKWFLHVYAGKMAREMREWGPCTGVAPGMGNTPLFSEPKPDKPKPEDMADAMMFALHLPERANVLEVTVMPTG